MEITSGLVIPVAEAKVLELAYKASKFVNIERAYDEMFIAGEIVKLLDVAENTNTLLTYAESQQILQGIIGIGKLKI